MKYKILKRIKCARWIPIRSFDLCGGDYELWMSHGNPIAEWYCSNCREEAIFSCDNEFCLTKYCGNCGLYMINGDVQLPYGKE